MRSNGLRRVRSKLAHPRASAIPRLRAPRASLRLLAALSGGLASLLACIPAWADDGLPSALVCATADQPGSGGALDASINAGLEDLAVVSITKRPGLDLVTVQLALDCVGETPKCLEAVAAQANVDVLISPMLEQDGGELVMSVLRFDARSRQLRRAVRRQQGETLSSEMLALVPGMLRELFGMPESKAAETPQLPAASQPAEAEASQAAQPASEPAASGGRDLPIAPFVIGGAGALILGGGLVSGFIMQHTEQALTDQAIDDVASARSAQDKESRGKTEETVANVLFAVGGTTLAVGAVWLVIELVKPERSKTSEQTAFVPLLNPDGVGLAFVHRGNAL